MVNRVKAPGKGGLDRVEFSDEEIEKVKMMASVGATQAEVANYFGVSIKTIQDKFNDYFKQGFADFQISIRRQQAREAFAGNSSLLIWLGKNCLGQRDFKDTEEQIKAAVLQAVQAALAAKENKDE